MFKLEPLYKVIARAKKIAEDIRKEAEGKQCITCAYCLGHICVRPHDLQGHVVYIWRSDAVACKFHKEKVNAARVHVGKRMSHRRGS